MGAIEDSRKLLRDFLAPELRAIATRLDALEKGIDGFDRRLDDIDHRAERRHDEVLGAIRQVLDLNSIQQRLARLEAKEGLSQ
jgi:tetrahydromethanopterin S-methyltransferase subunit G